MKRTVSPGWIADESTPPLLGAFCYEVLLAGGVTCLAEYAPDTLRTPVAPTEEIPNPPDLVEEVTWWHLQETDFSRADAIRERVYAWRVPSGNWEPALAVDMPWFPSGPNVDRIRAGVLCDVLCRDGSFGTAWRQLSAPTEEAPEGVLVWEWWVRNSDESAPDVVFWRFHLSIAAPPAEKFPMTVLLHPTIRKNNLLLADFLKPPVTFVIPEMVPGNVSRPPVVPALLEGTSPQVELVELWATLNDLHRYMSDPDRKSGQLYYLQHMLLGYLRDTREAMDRYLQTALQEGR